MMPRRMATWLGVVTLGLVGCSVDPQGAGGEGAPTTAESSSGSLPPFLDLVGRAKDNTPFRGTRRFRLVKGQGVLEVREDVGADGTGQFAIELLDTVSLLPDTDPVSFPLVHENAARFQWQMRDFRIWSLQQASANYSINLLPTPPPVAGIPCERVEFVRFSSPGERPGHFEADIDPTTGFVLAWREFDEFQQPVAESVFETFAYGGDVSNLSLSRRSFAAQPLDLNSSLSSQVGAEVFVPDVFPSGYELVGGEVLTIPNLPSLSSSALLQPGSWVRLMASDGIQTLSFAHSVSQAVSNAAPGDLRVVSLGDWEVGFGEFGGTRFVVAGRVKVAGLASVVQSAF
ncbi:MAG: hypothetical protein ISQ11_11205 [Planctomycetes bacterium]|nr:hypothetical protein [Planctomycetota bacterium]